MSIFGIDVKENYKETVEEIKEEIDNKDPGTIINDGKKDATTRLTEAREIGDKNIKEITEE